MAGGGAWADGLDRGPSSFLDLMFALFYRPVAVFVPGWWRVAVRIEALASFLRVLRLRSLQSLCSPYSLALPFALTSSCPTSSRIFTPYRMTYLFLFQQLMFTQKTGSVIKNQRLLTLTYCQVFIQQSSWPAKVLLEVGAPNF